MKINKTNACRGFSFFWIRSLFWKFWPRNAKFLFVKTLFGQNFTNVYFTYIMVKVSKLWQSKFFKISGLTPSLNFPSFLYVFPYFRGKNSLHKSKFPRHQVHEIPLLFFPRCGQTYIQVTSAYCRICLHIYSENKNWFPFRSLYDLTIWYEVQIACEVIQDIFRYALLVYNCLFPFLLLCLNLAHYPLTHDWHKLSLAKTSDPKWLDWILR